MSWKSVARTYKEARKAAHTKLQQEKAAKPKAFHPYQIHPATRSPAPALGSKCLIHKNLKN